MYNAEVVSPKYVHNDETSKFLGQINVGNGIHDLYFSAEQNNGTVIARYGDDSEEYISGSIFGQEFMDPELSAAFAVWVTSDKTNELENNQKG